MFVNLNTTPITYNKPIQPSFKSFSFKKLLNKDVFVKTAEPDLLSLPQEKIFQVINKSINSSKNKLGSGSEATVWRIVDTNYCVRVPHNNSEPIDSKFDTNLTDSDKVNHTLIKLGGEATIMPIISGISFCCDSEQKDKKVVELIEKMPITAYEKLIKQVIDAESKNMSFDPGWKNIIVNNEPPALTAIDFYKDFNSGRPRTLGKIFTCLAFPRPTTDKQQQTCIGKLYLAALSLMEKNPQIPFEKFGFDSLLDYLADFRLASSGYCKVIEANVNSLESADSKQKNFAIKVLKALVKQIFDVASDS